MRASETTARLRQLQPFTIAVVAVALRPRLGRLNPDFDSRPSCVSIHSGLRRVQMRRAGNR